MAYVLVRLDVLGDGPLGGDFRLLAYGSRPAPGHAEEGREQHEAQSALHKTVSFQFLKTFSMSSMLSLYVMLPRCPPYG
jgi:hypothetical protein